MKTARKIIKGDEEFSNFDPITIGAIITGLTSAGVGAYDAKKRREIDKAIAEANAKEQRRIADELLKAKTEADKIRLFDEILAKARRRKYLPIYIVGGIMVVGLIAGVILVTRKK